MDPSPGRRELSWVHIQLVISLRNMHNSLYILNRVIYRRDLLSTCFPCFLLNILNFLVTRARSGGWGRSTNIVEYLHLFHVLFALYWVELDNKYESILIMLYVSLNFLLIRSFWNLFNRYLRYAKIVPHLLTQSETCLFIDKPDTDQSFECGNWKQG